MLGRNYRFPSISGLLRLARKDTTPKTTKMFRASDDGAYCFIGGIAQAGGFHWTGPWDLLDKARIQWDALPLAVRDHIIETGSGRFDEADEVSDYRTSGVPAGYASVLLNDQTEMTKAEIADFIEANLSEQDLKRRGQVHLRSSI